MFGSIWVLNSNQVLALLQD
jgi:hypothetical protein